MVYCVGKGSQAAKTELEKVLARSGTTGITSAEAVKELAKMYYKNLHMNSLC
jgi:hypothetical protein